MRPHLGHWYWIRRDPLAWFGFVVLGRGQGYALCLTWGLNAQQRRIFNCPQWLGPPILGAWSIAHLIVFGEVDGFPVMQAPRWVRWVVRETCEQCDYRMAWVYRGL